MHSTNHNPRGRRQPRLPLLVILATFICAATVTAQQLPAGTRDAASQPQQDPLRSQAAEALAKQDYATAAKLLSTLAEKNPNDAPVLYTLASAQDALDQASEAEATYRRAIAAHR
jgi:cytochrome c-type biogenesis protein CcmH/NrfG